MSLSGKLLAFLLLWVVLGGLTFLGILLLVVGPCHPRELSGVALWGWILGMLGSLFGIPAWIVAGHRKAEGPLRMALAKARAINSQAQVPEGE